MAKAYIQAVKYVAGQGWIACEPHQAKMWEARIGARLLGRYPQKWKAADVIEQELKRKLGLARAYSLGQRMEPRQQGVGAYAISLTSEQYEQQFPKALRLDNLKK